MKILWMHFLSFIFTDSIVFYFFFSSDTASNEDTNKNGPHSPTPSSSSSQGTVKRSPNSNVSGSVVGKTTPNRPRHLKQRKEVFKGGSASINGKIIFFF